MRIAWVDIAKGIGIILVTVGHTNARHLFNDYAGHWINGFHMPLFFVLAGLCFNKVHYPKFSEYLKRKCLVLGWPFFALTMFMALLSIPLYLGDDPRFSFVGQLTALLHLSSMVNTFWFIRTLFEVEIVYYICAMAIKSEFADFIISLAVGIVGAFVIPEGGKPLQYNTFLVSFGFYGIGVYARKLFVDDSQRWLKTIIEAKYIWCFIIGMALLCIYSISVKLVFPYMVGYSIVKLGNPYLFVPLSLTAILGVSLLSAGIVKMRFLCDVLSWLGMNSIILMAIHGHLGVFAASWVSVGVAGPIAKILEYTLFAILIWAIAFPLKVLVRLPIKK